HIQNLESYRLDHLPPVARKKTNRSASSMIGAAAILPINSIGTSATADRARHSAASNLGSRGVFGVLCRRSLRAGEEHHSTLTNRIFDVAPADVIRTKTCQPDDEVDGVPQRHEPN